MDNITEMAGARIKEQRTLARRNRDTAISKCIKPVRHRKINFEIIRPADQTPSVFLKQQQALRTREPEAPGRVLNHRVNQRLYLIHFVRGTPKERSVPHQAFRSSQPEDTVRFCERVFVLANPQTFPSELPWMHFIKAQQRIDRVAPRRLIPPGPGLAKNFAGHWKLTPVSPIKMHDRPPAWGG